MKGGEIVKYSKYILCIYFIFFIIGYLLNILYFFFILGDFVGEFIRKVDDFINCILGG